MHCLNPYVLEIHQSCIGFYRNPLPILHGDITELVDVTLLALLYLPLLLAAV